MFKTMFIMTGMAALTLAGIAVAQPDTTTQTDTTAQEIAQQPPGRGLGQGLRDGRGVGRTQGYGRQQADGTGRGYRQAPGAGRGYGAGGQGRGLAPGQDGRNMGQRRGMAPDNAQPTGPMRRGYGRTTEQGRGYGPGGGQGRGLGQGGPNFVDTTGDGTCDNFVDTTGDGLCDNRQGPMRRGYGRTADQGRGYGPGGGQGRGLGQNRDNQQRMPATRQFRTRPTQPEPQADQPTQ